jgi:hypothetical protein
MQMIGFHPARYHPGITVIHSNPDGIAINDNHHPDQKSSNAGFSGSRPQREGCPLLEMPYPPVTDRQSQMLCRLDSRMHSKWHESGSCLNHF